MSKRVQFVLCDEAWSLVEENMKQANEGFRAGSITYAALINEMLLTSKVDIKQLQLKHTDYRKAIRHAAKEGLELDSVIKMLQELKTGQAGKRASKSAGKEGSSDG